MSTYRIAHVGLLLFICFFVVDLRAQNWTFDLESAKEEAMNTDRLIVLVFQGSDWCAPCIRLDKEIWSTDAFKTYAEDNLVMVKADFPRRKENKLEAEQTAKNEALAEKYNEEGAFPLVIVMNSKGEVLRRSSYEKLSPEDYIRTLESLR